MLKGEVFGRQLFENQIFALFINTFLNGNNGVCGDYLNGMEVTYSGSNVTVDTGAVCIQGRFLEEDSGTTISAGTNSLFCKLVIEIDLDKVNTDETFNQGYYKIITDANNYPAVTQTDIVGTNSGVYQYELARFKTSASGITDFVDTRTYLDIPTIYDEVRQMVQDAIDSIEDGSAFMLKPETLFEGSARTDTSITLSDNPSNYEEIEIFYNRDGSVTEASPCKSIKIKSDTEYVILDMNYPTTTSNITLQISGVLLHINDNVITQVRGSMLGIGSSGVVQSVTNNYFIITKILGYKHGQVVE